MPLSKDPGARQRQLANLRPGRGGPAGNTHALVHGGHSQALVRDVEGEVRELMRMIGEFAPVRDHADTVALERAARALKRYRAVSSWCDAHGRLTERGRIKGGAELELKCERQLGEALAELGLSPRSRAALGLDIARARRTLEQEIAAATANGDPWARFENEGVAQ